jgi:hypothetical protein
MLPLLEDAAAFLVFGIAATSLEKDITPFNVLIDGGIRMLHRQSTVQAHQADAMLTQSIITWNAAVVCLATMRQNVHYSPDPNGSAYMWYRRAMAGRICRGCHARHGVEQSDFERKSTYQWESLKGHHYFTSEYMADVLLPCQEKLLDMFPHPSLLSVYAGSSSLGCKEGRVKRKSLIAPPEVMEGRAVVPRITIEGEAETGCDAEYVFETRDVSVGKGKGKARR